MTFMETFGGLCLNVIYSDGCSDADCTSLSHQLPSIEKFEAKLQSYPKSNVKLNFELVQTFPSQIQSRFFPAFANVYAQRRQLNEIKQLLSSCQQSMSTFNCSDYIVEAMNNNGWSQYDIVKFLVENHEQK